MPSTTFIGIVALPTLKNTVAYNIIVTRPEGTRDANLQVTQLRRRLGKPSKHW